MRRCDVVITAPTCKIAVEADGPTHFVAPTSVTTIKEFNASNATPSGSTQLRNWLLQQHGYHVVSVPFYIVPRLGGRYVFSSGGNAPQPPGEGASCSQDAVMQHLDEQVHAILAQEAANTDAANLSPLLKHGST